MKNYYAILGVSPTASQVEIKRAYRKLAVKFHPDKNPDPAVEDLFKEINEAYDVVGDSVKRARYHEKWQNPFAEYDEGAGKPVHRDPAYRRHRRYAPPGPIESDVHFLMRTYLPYIRWICWVGALVTTLFFVDYVLPHDITTERIVYSSFRKVEPNYYVSRTASGKIINHYAPGGKRMEKGMMIRLAETPIFGSPMWVEHADGSGRARALAFLYGPLFFFPLTIFCCSFLGIIFRKKIDFCFNLSVVSGILLVIFWFLL